MDWTEVCIKVPAATVDEAAAIANMAVPYGIYIEDYSDLEQGAREIARIDLIDEDLLAKERIFDELCRLLPLVRAADLRRFALILSAAVPVLAPTLGFQQHSSHHAYDVFTHTAYVVEGVDSNLTLRWAALLHDIGKVPTFTLDENGQGHFLGHAQAGAKLANQTLLSLKAPTQLRETVVFLIE